MHDQQDSTRVILRGAQEGPTPRWRQEEHLLFGRTTEKPSSKQNVLMAGVGTGSEGLGENLKARGSSVHSDTGPAGAKGDLRPQRACDCQRAPQAMVVRLGWGEGGKRPQPQFGCSPSLFVWPVMSP